MVHGHVEECHILDCEAGYSMTLLLISMPSIRTQNHRLPGEGIKACHVSEYAIISQNRDRRI